jgi:hypothetical protein
MPSLGDGHEAVLDAAGARGQQALSVEAGRARNPIEHLGAVVCHLGLDAHIGAGEPLPWRGGAEVEVVFDRPGKAPVADGTDKPAAVEMDWMLPDQMEVAPVESAPMPETERVAPPNRKRIGADQNRGVESASGSPERAFGKHGQAEEEAESAYHHGPPPDFECHLAVSLPGAVSGDVRSTSQRERGKVA